MALSWNEIKDRALSFSKEWEGESRERAEKDTFWNEFFYVFGISRRRLASFEEPVKKLNNHQGFIDLFCLFADDTGIFEKDTFMEFIEVKTHEDGSDLGAWLAQFFQVLNTPSGKRQNNLDEHLGAFPYVNGKLFEESLPIAAFNSQMRKIMIQCSGLDWGQISPAIFGSMFQSVMKPEERRNLGAHYTSEKNIMKLIKPLFLDELQTEFEKIKRSKKKLNEFLKKLGSLKFLDPACGCGNFLLISYRELRLLELEVLKVLYGKQQVIGIDHIMNIDVDQFYGIEIDEFPARIAEVAMWLMDHQMNLLISEAFGLYYARLPLRKSATIVNGNALRLDWEEIVPKSDLNYILGNPPFIGSKNQAPEQKYDMNLVFGSLKGAGILDFVSAWYLKATRYIRNTRIGVAFVSTNSITQGEQVSVLWNEIINNHKMSIHFAHRTFNWKNEAKGNAAVHVVIIGFGKFSVRKKILFEYEGINDEPLMKMVKNINPYLVDAPYSVVKSRTKPLCSVFQIIRGSETTDNGNFLLTEDEKKFLLKTYPTSRKFIRTFKGGSDVINNRSRWCLWLKNASISEYRNIPMVMEKIKSVRQFRANSNKKRTQKWAEYPTLFSEDRQPSSDYLVIPKISSERRKYIPIAYLDSEIIINNTVSALPYADRYYFGILTSLMHMAWVKNTCGRMKSDYIYSIQIVYNNYPWPMNPSQKSKDRVEERAQNILAIRTEFPESSLADLYDPLTMPPKLVKAHQELDRAVDRCYRPQAFTTEAARIEYLFELYNEYTAPLLKIDKKKKKAQG